MNNLGLPSRFAIPLNTVELEAGTYTITVNGTNKQSLFVSAGTCKVSAEI